MGSQYMLDYVQKQYEETKKLFDAKKSCLKSGVEKYRVLWMQNGAVRTSTHAELMASCPEYAELYKLQQGGQESA